MVFGLPMHPLVAHAVVICVPLAALGAIQVFWPAVARRHWPAVLFVATMGLIAVPLTTQSGESLEERVGESEVVEAHAKQGEQVLPFVIVLWLSAVGICLLIDLIRRTSRSPNRAAGPRLRWRPVATAVLAAMALVGGVGGIAGRARRPQRSKGRLDEVTPFVCLAERVQAVAAPVDAATASTVLVERRR